MSYRGLGPFITHQSAPQSAHAFVDFVNTSPTPYHAVRNSVLKLEKAGFTRLKEREDWSKVGLRWGGRYYVTRNQSSLIAFTLPPSAPARGSISDTGVSIVGTHTDSPCFKIKPISKRSKLGWLEVGVETYGGGLWHTWLDRDLGLAGRVVLSSGDLKSPSFSTHLVHLPFPILRLPTLAIHLDRTQSDRMQYNPETQMVPVLAPYETEQLGAASGGCGHSHGQAKPIAVDLDAASNALNAPVSAGAGASKASSERSDWESWDRVSARSTESSSPAKSTANCDPLDITPQHHPMLLQLLCHALTPSSSVAESPESLHPLAAVPAYPAPDSSTIDTIRPSQIHALDLSLFDVQPATLGGAAGELIFAPRCDNLFSSFCAVEGLVRSVTGDKEAEDAGEDAKVNLIAMWDNEEIGSVSAYGAESNFLEAVLKRLSSVNPTKQEGSVDRQGEANPAGADFERLIANSFLLSCDMAHAVHPSFPDKHESEHRPYLNNGPVIKTNAKQRYATTGPTDFLFRRIASEAGVPVQSFVARNDMPCGSTIGPLVSKIGLRTVDIGCSQLAMHSIRETAGSLDIEHLARLFNTYFRQFGDIDSRTLSDE